MRDTVVAGDTLDFATAVPDYPATAGWTLKFRLIPRTVGVTPIEITAATYNTDQYRVQLGPQETAQWPPGDYSLARWVEKGGARYTVETQPELPIQVTVLPDPATANALDSRSSAQQHLAAIEAFMGAKATSGPIAEYEIAGRRLVNYKPAELIQMADYFRRQVANEETSARLAAGLGNPRHVYARLNRAS